MSVTNIRPGHLATYCWPNIWPAASYWLNIRPGDKLFINCHTLSPSNMSVTNISPGHLAIYCWPNIWPAASYWLNIRPGDKLLTNYQTWSPSNTIFIIQCQYVKQLHDDVHGSLSHCPIEEPLWGARGGGLWSGRYPQVMGYIGGGRYLKVLWPLWLS